MPNPMITDIHVEKEEPTITIGFQTVASWLWNTHLTPTPLEPWTELGILCLWHVGDNALEGPTVRCHKPLAFLAHWFSTFSSYGVVSSSGGGNLSWSLFAPSHIYVFTRSDLKSHYLPERSRGLFAGFYTKTSAKSQNTFTEAGFYIWNLWFIFTWQIKDGEILIILCARSSQEKSGEERSIPYLIFVLYTKFTSKFYC